MIYSLTYTLARQAIGCSSNAQILRSDSSFSVGHIPVVILKRIPWLVVMSFQYLLFQNFHIFPSISEFPYVS